ncbi:hypothetical protein DAI22_11g133300 [Oryza sativa Japonica Group]|nr:hypothetical protein DAI22_11g133300 [Oryza sativa Japonica Group]
MTSNLHGAYLDDWDDTIATHIAFGSLGGTGYTRGRAGTLSGKLMKEVCTVVKPTEVCT